MDDKLLQNMRARVAQCRRLARAVNDPIATKALTKMAEDGESDIAKLEKDIGDGIRT